MLSNEENMLFGIFALDMRRVTKDRLIHATERWVADPSKDLPDCLMDEFNLAQEDREVIEAAMNKAISMYGGNAADALEAFGGEAQISDSFGGSIEWIGGKGVTAKMRPSSPRPGSPETPVELLEDPATRYAELNLLGRGGMGRVLLVRDEHMDRKVALKELHIQGSGSRVPQPEFVARFVREAQITGTLEHPSIAPVYDLAGRDDGSFYYTMKFIEGKTLDQAIREAESLEERLNLLPHFVDLCQAIAFSHSKGIIHRDIKPSNVVLGDYGETTVIDWGLAKELRNSEPLDPPEEPALNTPAADVNSVEETILSPSGISGKEVRTMAGNVLGTPMYMPPEQASGNLQRVDERSDVYSLGIVLYQLLTGTTPFAGKTTQEVLHSTIHDPPRPIQSLERHAPAYLSDIANKAMSKAPDDRFQSAKELVEILQAYVPKRPMSRAKKVALLILSILVILTPVLILIANAVTDAMVVTKITEIRERGGPTTLQELSYPAGRANQEAAHHGLPSPLGMLSTLNVQFPIVYRKDDGFIDPRTVEFYDAIRVPLSMVRQSSDEIDPVDVRRAREALSEYVSILDKIHEILALPPEHYGRLLVPVFGDLIPEDPLKSGDPTFASILETCQSLLRLEFVLANAEGRRDEGATAAASLIDLIHHLRAWPWPPAQEHATQLSEVIFDGILWFMSQEDNELSPDSIAFYQQKLRESQQETPLLDTFRLMALRSFGAFEVLNEGKSAEVIEDLNQDPYSFAMMATAIYCTKPLRFWRNIDELKFVLAAEELVDLARRPYNEVRESVGEVDALFRKLSLTRLRYPVTSWIVQQLPEERYPGVLIREEAKHKVRFTIIDSALALYLYEREHGAYPSQLEFLVPAFIPVVPTDVFSGEVLRYRPQGEGYVLYSVGPDGEDDSGVEDDIAWVITK